MFESGQLYNRGLCLGFRVLTKFSMSLYSRLKVTMPSVWEYAYIAIYTLN